METGEEEEVEVELKFHGQLVKLCLPSVTRSVRRSRGCWLGSWAKQYNCL